MYILYHLSIRISRWCGRGPAFLVHLWLHACFFKLGTHGCMHVFLSSGRTRSGLHACFFKLGTHGCMHVFFKLGTLWSDALVYLAAHACKCSGRSGVLPLLGSALSLRHWPGTLLKNWPLPHWWGNSSNLTLRTQQLSSMVRVFSLWHVRSIFVCSMASRRCHRGSS